MALSSSSESARSYSVALWIQPAAEVTRVWLGVRGERVRACVRACAVPRTVKEAPGLAGAVGAHGAEVDVPVVEDGDGTAQLLRRAVLLCAKERGSELRTQNSELRGARLRSMIPHLAIHAHGHRERAVVRVGVRHALVRDSHTTPARLKLRNRHAPSQRRNGTRWHPLPARTRGVVPKCAVRPLKPPSERALNLRRASQVSLETTARRNKQQQQQQQR
jgi:hypothetical protein